MMSILNTVLKKMEKVSLSINLAAKQRKSLYCSLLEELESAVGA
jgi:hypothetical protein